ncbi:hypothetical protein WR25_07289 [Diploscapter pachys]|uniref:Uncharacterized protein n=1 Tax=Diploscapter pachys TaxID=2018661 RepID=A0A2A2M5U7_9BILA|nr:hypothetical protein WR25_07289 [Diploscapter pachys]
MSRSLSAARIASTAAASAAFSSPRPVNVEAAIAAASVTRTISRTRTRSRSVLASDMGAFRLTCITGLIDAGGAGYNADSTGVAVRQVIRARGTRNHRHPGLEPGSRF